MTHPSPSDSRQERIAELEQEEQECDKNMKHTVPGTDTYAIAWNRKMAIRSKLSRLRNESGGGEVVQAEPVAWQYRRNIGGHQSEWCAMASVHLPYYKNLPEYEVRPLYTAAPQPGALRKALERIQTWLRCTDLPKDAVVNFAPFGKYQATPLLLSDLRNAFAALSTPAPAQSDERAGLERAAKWHDEQAEWYMEKMRSGDSSSYADIAHMHSVSAKSLRSLAQGDRSDG